MFPTFVGVAEGAEELLVIGGGLLLREVAAGHGEDAIVHLRGCLQDCLVHRAH